MLPCRQGPVGVTRHTARLKEIDVLFLMRIQLDLVDSKHREFDFGI